MEGRETVEETNANDQQLTLVSESCMSCLIGDQQHENCRDEKV